jgi:hypothetical protein
MPRNRLKAACEQLPGTGLLDRFSEQRAHPLHNSFRVRRHQPPTINGKDNGTSDFGEAAASRFARIPRYDVLHEL